MQVRILGSSAFQRYLGSSETLIEVEDGSTVGDVLVAAGIPTTEVGLLTCNGRRVEPAVVVREGDEIGVYPRAGGG